MEIQKIHCHIGVQLAGTVRQGVSMNEGLNHKGQCLRMEIHPNGVLCKSTRGELKLVPFSNISEIDYYPHTEEDVKQETPKKQTGK